MLNFSDSSRYGKSFKAVKKGYFWGLPANIRTFSVLTVLTAAADQKWSWYTTSCWLGASIGWRRGLMVDEYF